MRNTGHSVLPRQSDAVRKLAFLTAILLGACAASGDAAQQNSAPFSVNISLQASGVSPAGTAAAVPAAVLCRSGTVVGAFGTPVTVVCTTGATAAAGLVSTNSASLAWTSMPDTTYRFLLGNYREGEAFGAIDNYGGAGTVATWRRVRLSDRDYLELMLHW